VCVNALWPPASFGTALDEQIRTNVRDLTLKKSRWILRTQRICWGNWKPVSC